MMGGQEGRVGRGRAAVADCGLAVCEWSLPSEATPSGRSDTSDKSPVCSSETTQPHSPCGLRDRTVACMCDRKFLQNRRRSLRNWSHSQLGKDARELRAAATPGQRKSQAVGRRDWRQSTALHFPWQPEFHWSALQARPKIQATKTAQSAACLRPRQLQRHTTATQSPPQASGRARRHTASRPPQSTEPQTARPQSPDATNRSTRQTPQTAKIPAAQSRNTKAQTRLQRAAREWRRDCLVAWGLHWRWLKICDGRAMQDART